MPAGRERKAGSLGAGERNRRRSVLSRFSQRAGSFPAHSLVGLDAGQVFVQTVEAFVPAFPMPVALLDGFEDVLAQGELRLPTLVDQGPVACSASFAVPMATTSGGVAAYPLLPTYQVTPVATNNPAISTPPRPAEEKLLTVRSADVPPTPAPPVGGPSIFQSCSSTDARM